MSRNRMVSVIIPSRGERYLQPTINDVLSKAAGNVEVVAVLDGYWPDPPLVTGDKRLRIVHAGKPMGMRNAINAGVAVSRGTHIMKLDAHCLVSEGFDRVLLEHYHEENWVVVPRRYSLDPVAWKIKTEQPPKDHHYLSWPYVDEKGEFGLHGRWWRERDKALRGEPLTDEMTSQGSSYFMARTHWERMGFLSTKGFGDFIQEFQEIGCRTWLSGGAVKSLKTCHYAHWHKGKEAGRGYFVSKRSWDDGCAYSADLWVNDLHGLPRKFEWLVEHFWPVPTWPADWKGFDHSALGVRSGRVKAAV